MKVYKFKCLKCKEKTQASSPMAIFNFGCPLCQCKRIEILGHSKEDKI